MNKRLITKKNVIVEYNEEKGYVYNNWIGFQTAENVIESCKEILVIYKTLNCSKVLNDNRQVRGPWNKASEWVQQDWFPKMIDAGMKQFAWVFPDNVFAQISANQAMPDTDLVCKFEDFEAAEKWLASSIEEAV